MTSTVSRPSPSRGAAFGGPPLPQVNLLPPEVRAGRQLRRAKLWMGVGVAATCLLVAGGYVLSAVGVVMAERELAAQQERTNDLLAEKALYAEVTPVVTELARVAAAQLAVSTTEVLWADYLGAVTAVLPADASVATIAVEVSNGEPTDDPLVSPHFGRVTFTGYSTTTPDTIAWLEGLSTIPGFADPTLTVTQKTAVDDVVLYEWTVRVHLSQDSFAGRFIEGEG